ncbi:hypothetical protein MJO28_013396 [Puccinia striiformis f. sp. tritici]|nr:hypothetical protein Pst134EA_024158 [Puccinia striiformis f. sp. tritici]KAH9453275.1 hypothetical protein Pst134EA_024158 [Puccinia striiformis f. sp. tritici]KAI7941111.1 hypothetical protein MJO28_013396 [Puccinia striiformis f. sp. tritici]KAI9626661.1 hypothetical protein H4Q26_017759 [Puccinia striiformis f. sp. tritici PST-130]
MSFYSFFFIIAIVLWIQTEIAHANFLCNDNGSEKNRAAKLGYCLRAIKPKDHTDPRITADLTHKYWFVALARHVGPNPEEFTCEGRSVAFGKKEKIFCCHPQVHGMTLAEYKAASISTIKKVCYPRDAKYSKGKGKGKGKGGKGGKGGNGGKVQG